MRVGSCMKFGKILFEGSQELEHTPSEKDIQRRGALVGCTSVFLQEPPHSLMEAIVDVEKTEGMLKCIKCKSRVGHWSWSGSQCSCGIWVTPSFQITLSKMDFKVK